MYMCHTKIDIEMSMRMDRCKCLSRFGKRDHLEQTETHARDDGSHQGLCKIIRTYAPAAS